MNNNEDSLQLRKQLFEQWPNSIHWQRLMTWLVGQPHEGQALTRRSPWASLWSAVAAFIWGVLLGIYAVRSGNWYLLPIGWIFTVHAARYGQVVLVHNASHRNFVGQARIDDSIGRMISAGLMIEPFDFYKASHRYHHIVSVLSSIEDPSVALLRRAGLAGAKGTSRSMVHLAMALLSPRYHLGELALRLHSNLVLGNLWVRLAAVTWLAVVGLACWWVGVIEVSLAFLLPITVLYEQARLLRIIVEHDWSHSGESPCKTQGDPRAELLAKTPAVFLGSAPPQTKTASAWIAWTVSMVGDGLVRLIVLPGDSGVAHDWHHIEARGDWANAIAAQAAFFARNPELAAQRRALLGFRQALRSALASLS